jgi:trimeric autotransporter adhesin
LNTTGSNNTANGYHALLNNTTGDFNTANGLEALLSNTTGIDNTANGYQALVNSSTGFGNIALGVFAGAGVTTANNVIAVGAAGANIDNSCFIGQIYSNVQPVIGIDPDYVTIGSNGRLGRSNLNGSSRRFKHDIHPMDKASEVIFALKPVTFRYNKEYDAMQRSSFGLIAEDVAEVAPDLVGRNKNGEPDSVRYEQINAMLLNEFVKEHRKVHDQARKIREQRATVSELRSTVIHQQKSFQSKFAEQEKQIKALASDLHRVSAQIEVTKLAPTIVVNNLEPDEPK